MDKHNSYDNYTQLLAKVDAFFESVVARQGRFFSCTAGCFGCCRSGLSVLPIEAQFIKDWIHNRPDIMSQLSDEKHMNDDPQYCNFLDKRGECAIYSARPLICRSHGLPVSWRSEESKDGDLTETRDVCPLNFQGVDLNTLHGDDVLSLDKINTILSLINRQFTGSDSDKRVKLSSIN